MACAQILAGSWTDGSMLTDSSSSHFYYNEVLREMESPYALTVTGMTNIQGVGMIRIEQSKTRPLHCL